MQRVKIILLNELNNTHEETHCHSEVSDVTHGRSGIVMNIACEESYSVEDNADAQRAYRVRHLNLRGPHHHS